MSARIIVELLPSGKAGHVLINITSAVSDGGELTHDEIIFTLEETLQGIRDGHIVAQHNDSLS